MTDTLMLGTSMPTTCGELFDHVNTLFQNQGEGDSRYASNGEPYVTFVVGGIKPEGKLFPIGSDTKAEAIAVWLYQLISYARNKGATKIYWRQRPEFREFQKDENFFKPFVTIWSRLLLA